jgi:hypothetical protein
VSDLRCPYCAHEGQFRLMTKLDEYSVCENCGHRATYTTTGFKCDCENCSMWRTVDFDRA